MTNVSYKTGMLIGPILGWLDESTDLIDACPSTYMGSEFSGLLVRVLEIGRTMSDDRSRVKKMAGATAVVGGLFVAACAIAKKVDDRRRERTGISETVNTQTSLDRPSSSARLNSHTESASNIFTLPSMNNRAQFPADTTPRPRTPSTTSEASFSASPFVPRTAHSTPATATEDEGEMYGTFGSNLNESYGYGGTTRTTFTTNGCPQVPTRERFKDIPEAQRTPEQWAALHDDQAARTAAMDDALRNLKGFNYWG